MAESCCSHCGQRGAEVVSALHWDDNDRLVGRLNEARAASDWRGMMKLEGRIEELMAHRPDADCDAILAMFSYSHSSGFAETSSTHHARSFIKLEERRIDYLGKLQRFRDQGSCMCGIGCKLLFLERKTEAYSYFQRARDVGAAHGFFSLESHACSFLGSASIDEGRTEEGLELLRNALAAAKLNE